MKTFVQGYRERLCEYVRQSALSGAAETTDTLYRELNADWRYLPISERLRIRWILWRLRVRIAQVRFWRRVRSLFVGVPHV